jgi:uncharacterized protein (DUF849 family)
MLPADRIVVMSAPNGARRGKADHPALPITPSELAEEAMALVSAGVSVLHLHVRDAAGAHTLDADAYRAAIEAIRARVGDALVLQVTTEAVGRFRGFLRAGLFFRGLIPGYAVMLPAPPYF